jgi:DNA-binding CsgD family transcriptional regulator
MTYGVQAQGFTPRERKIADLVSTGHTNAGIGVQLQISHHTVKTHLQRMFRKTGTVNRADLVRFLAEGLEPGTPMIRTTEEVVETLKAMRTQRASFTAEWNTPAFYRQEGEVMILDALIRRLMPAPVRARPRSTETR